MGLFVIIEICYDKYTIKWTAIAVEIIGLTGSMNFEQPEYPNIGKTRNTKGRTLIFVMKFVHWSKGPEVFSVNSKYIPSRLYPLILS